MCVCVCVCGCVCVFTFGFFVLIWGGDILFCSEQEKKKKKNIKLGWEGNGENLEGFKGGRNKIKIHCVKIFK